MILFTIPDGVGGVSGSYNEEDRAPDKRWETSSPAASRALNAFRIEDWTSSDPYVPDAQVAFVQGVLDGLGARIEPIPETVEDPDRIY